MNVKQIGMFMVSINPDIKDDIRKLIDTAILSDIERDVLRQRWVENATLEEIAKLYNVTRERIRQSEAKAFRRLRHPSDALESLMPQVQKTMLQQALRIILNFLQENETVDPIVEKINFLKLITLDDIEFSVRTYNCLKRANFHNAYELSLITPEKLKTLRNLGPKSYQEILDKMANVPTFEWSKEDE